MTGIDLRLGDCLAVLPTLESSSIDAVICDPPYPEISRPYGRMTEAEWHAMMRVVVPECRRVLKPSGSAVFILQPNSRKVGSMRLWLWEFVVWAGTEWNMVQDVWWWNINALPTVHCHRDKGLMRPSLKACVWLGDSECYRNQEGILWSQSDASKGKTLESRSLRYSPSTISMRDGRLHATAEERGGSTPYNVFPIGNAQLKEGHSASTPYQLVDLWTRYISPEGGTILDPFMGSGTTGLAALARGRKFVGVERDAGYFAIAEKRLADVADATPLFTSSAGGL